MTTSDSDKSARIERIRAIVNEDYDRIMKSDDAFVILNLSSDASHDEAMARYERYERFYRAENFQRLGDGDLTRKALDIRRAVGRAIVDVQAELGSSSALSEGLDMAAIPEVEPNFAALGDIYFRDGLTYVKLGDLEEGSKCFRRACDYDPTQGLALAYLAYTTFRQRMNDPDLVDESRANLAQARRMEPQNADVHVLVARFHMKLGEAEEAQEAIAAVERLMPDHPKLNKLHSRFQALTS